MTQHRFRRRHLGLAAITALCAGLAATGCSSEPSGPGVAGAERSSASASTAAGSEGKSVLAYSRCMRKHGIKDFPDPNQNGGLALNGKPGSDLDPANPQYKKADAACKPLMPHHERSQAEKDKVRSANLKYAKCMRNHGIKDFPDPSADGTLQVKAAPGSDLDPNNPHFTKANKACQKYQYIDPNNPPKLTSKGE